MTRSTIKHQMILLRGQQCELCGANGPLDQHEVINRARTRGNEQARELSFDPRISSLLCRSCHQRADTDAVRGELLRKNAVRYGAEAVIAALDAVDAVMIYTHGIRYNGDKDG